VPGMELMKKNVRYCTHISIVASLQLLGIKWVSSLPAFLEW
jgi:hypothetical protein